MFLARLRVRGRLAVLIAIPLLAVVGLAVVIAVGQVNRADAAGATVRSVNVASQVGAFVADLQRERLISVGALMSVATPTDVQLEETQVADHLADLKAALGTDAPERIRTAVAASSALDPVRGRVAATIEPGATATITPSDVVAAYDTTIMGIIDSLQLATDIDTSTSAGREVIALDALLRIDELNTMAATNLVIAAGSPTQQAIITYAGVQQAVAALAGRFKSYASPSQVQLYGLVTDAYTERTGPGFDAAFDASPRVTVAMMSPASLYPQFLSYVALGRFVETKIVADVTSAVGGQEDDDLILAWVTGVVAVLVLLLVAALSVLVARSIVRSLSQLSHSAERTAGLAEAELERVADDESEQASPVRLDPLEIAGEDEFGEVARAFQRVQHTAAALVERQVASRRNVAQMFGHVGRRTQNLVGRQLALIDSLEYDETDPQRLEQLYRLDHVASRLRRNAGSLVVLSGATDEGAYYSPLPLADVVRLALGEIEDYTRVDIFMPASTAIQPAVINDLVLMLAELMENATAFSPPHTRVSVSAAAHDGSIVIVDEGIGMSPERLEEENARLAQRERLDLAPTEVLGLFVVGRLARRHGMTVTLSATPGGGTTVVVDLGPHVVAAQRIAPARAVGRVPEGEIVRARQPAPLVEEKLPRRQREWTETPALSARPFNEETLDRATRVLESGQRWNAFEVLPARYSDLTPALATAPAPAPVPETDEPLTHIEPSNGYQAPWSNRDTDPGAGTSTLTRRVPGATTLHDQPVVHVREARSLDPDEARDLIEQFEFGVAQALREVGPAPDEEDTTT